MIADAELRSRSAQLLSEAARKAGAGVAKGALLHVLICGWDMAGLERQT